MIHKIETVNNLHTSYKITRWKVLTKGLTKTVSISLHRYRAYDANGATSAGLCMYAVFNRKLNLYIKISFFVIRETVTVEYFFLKTIKIYLEDGASSITLV